MRSIRELGTALRRPETYTGHLREMSRTAATAALYPLGLANVAVDLAVHGLHVDAPSRPASTAPVMLVHGCGGNKANWIGLNRHLRRSGFDHIESLNYNPVGTTVPDIAARLVERVDAMRTRTGSAKVHLVGHSLGGIIIRYAVTHLGLDDVVACAVTVASPHKGAPAAKLGRMAERAGITNAAADIVAGCDVLTGLDEAAQPSAVTWVAYYSNLDLVVPGWCARIDVPALAAKNILIKDAGHIGMLLDPALMASLAAELHAGEQALRREPAVATAGI